jgi:hypothetical protein
VEQFCGGVLCNHYTKGKPGFGTLRSVLTAKTQYNLKNARGYFEEHLCAGDYYDESAESFMLPIFRIGGGEGIKFATIQDVTTKDAINAMQVPDPVFYTAAWCPVSDIPEVIRFSIPVAVMEI